MLLLFAASTSEFLSESEPSGICVDLDKGLPFLLVFGAELVTAGRDNVLEEKKKGRGGVTVLGRGTTGWPPI